MDYFKHKVIRMRNREINIRGIILSKSPKYDLASNPELKKDYEKFISPNSKKPITRWTRLSLSAQLDLVQKSGKIKADSIEFVYELLYEEASEVLHGTLYGLLSPLQLMDPKLASWDQKRRQWKMDLCVVFMMIADSLGEVGIFAARELKNKDLEACFAANNKFIIEFAEFVEKEVNRGTEE